MVAKKASISFVIALVIMNAVSCDSGNDLLNFPQQNSIIKDGIKYTIRTEKQIYEIEESVKVDFIIKNMSLKKIWIGLVTIASDFRIYIKKGNELIFDWPQGWVTVPSELTLEIGESKEYSYTWDSTNNNYDSENYGYCVPPGVYTIIMELLSYNPPGTGISINIEIK